MGAAEPSASQLGEGTHPVHSNISCLSQGSAAVHPWSWVCAPGQGLMAWGSKGLWCVESAAPDPEELLGGKNSAEV